MTEWLFSLLNPRLAFLLVYVVIRMTIRLLFYNMIVTIVLTFNLSY